MTQHSFLQDRGVLCIEGPDRYTFLQALITNDIYLLERSPAIYTALLNAQGKYLADFFIVQPTDALCEHFFIDMESAQIPGLMRLLTLYKLRSKVTVADVSATYKVAVFLGSTEHDQGLRPEFAAGQSICYKDPRLPIMGWRFLIHHQDHDLLQDCVADAAYRSYRFQQGIAEGAEELIPEKSVILEYGFDQLGAIAWNKGCYLGQELMARTKHRGMIQKRIFPIESHKNLPPKGTVIFNNDQKVGSIIYQEGGVGVALLRCAAEESVADIQKRIDQSDTVFTVKNPQWWPQG